MANPLSVFTYTPSDVILIIGGYQIMGWETINISRTVQSFQPVRGIRGKNTRTRNLDTSATLTLPLMQTSQSNDVLSAAHELDLLNGTGRLSLTLKDKSGSSIFSSDEAFITGYPAVTYSDDIEFRSWTIFCQTTASYAVNGNGSPLNSIFDSAFQTFSNLF